MKKIAILTLALTLVLAACKRSEEPAPEAAVAGTPTASTEVAPAEPTQTATGTEVGSAIPEYSSMWLDGSRFDLASRKGTVVLLNVWATWCGPCRYEIPELKKMQAELGPKGFEVVGISVDEGPGNEQEVRAFVAEKAIEYPVVLDPEGRILLLLETSTVPTTVLLDKNGKVMWYSVGVVQATNPALQAALAKVFAE